MEFIIGGVAAMGAGFVTNPMEVLKTRMQLQGELAAKGKHVVHYKNFLHAFYVVARNDGFFALQSGLIPALYVQLIMNGLRLGWFQMVESKGYITDVDGHKVFYKTVLIGGIGGMLGQYFSSPFSLVKTHLQNEAAVAIAVGHQHHHKGSWAALKKLANEYGIKGLFRGGLASLPRGYVASTSQMTSFDYAKQYLYKYEYFKDKPLLRSFCGSMVGGIAISVMVTPFDLILTRLYNQPVHANGEGKLYKNYFDCVIKIYQSEGLSAFYKGLGPMYFRLGPHSVLCLMFWDKLRNLYDMYIIK